MLRPPAQQEDTQFVRKWLEPLTPVHAEAVPGSWARTPLSDDLCDDMELRSIRRSPRTADVLPLHRRSCAGRAGLALHGARFGIADGELEWLNSDGRFEAVVPALPPQADSA